MQTENQARPLKNNFECERCDLHKRSRTICCKAVGPKDSPIMLVGEALGANEEVYGRPFVGDAGRKLNYLLYHAGIKRKSLLVTNAIRCRPPSNRKPTKKEMDACWPYLLYDILKFKPQVIVALGATAAHILQSAGQMKDNKLILSRQDNSYRGYPQKRTFRYVSKKGTVYHHSCHVISTHHPSACLRNWALDDLVIFDLKNAVKLTQNKAPFKTPETTIKVYKDLDAVKRLCKLLIRAPELVVDLETTGLDQHKADIMCIGFCMKPDKAHIIPIREQGNRLFWSASSLRTIKELLTDVFERSVLMGQNIKFDIKHLRKFLGIINYKISFDTMIAHSLIDENRPHNLTYLCQRYLRWEKYDAVMDEYKTTEGKKEVFKTWEVPNQVLWNYCGVDCDGTFQLKDIFETKLNVQKLNKAFKVEMGLIHPLADMEFRGLHVDKKKADKLVKVYTKKIHKLEYDLRYVATKYLMVNTDGIVDENNLVEFNPNSPVQVSNLLRAVGANLSKKTPSGQFSTGAAVINKLTAKKDTAGKLASKIRKYRLYTTKYLGTYLTSMDGEKGFLRFLSEGNRFHPTYNIGKSRTGRLSADDPAIQTLPRDADLRSMIIPDDPENQKIIAVDYSKIELCVMAYLSSDPVMCKELTSGVDLHTRMAVTVRLNRDPTDREFEKLAPEISKQERALAKCFHPDTEVLTKTGWKQIIDLDEGEEVVQAYPMADGDVILEWCIPLEVFTQPSSGRLVHLENEGINLRVTEDHRMLGWVSDYNWSVKYPAEFHKFRHWANAGVLKGCEPSRHDENLLRLCVAVQADGNYNGKQIRFGFSKIRKIKRLRRLLNVINCCDEDWTESPKDKNGVVKFNLKGKLAFRIRNVLDGKSFPWSWLKLPPYYRDVILDEARYWDSHQASNWRHYKYTSTDGQSIEVLQALASITCMKTRLVIEYPDNPDHKVQYGLSVKDHLTSRGGNVNTRYIEYEGEVACLSVPSSFVLVRDGQIPVITGQSVNFGIPYGVGPRTIVEDKADSFPVNMPMNQRINKVKRIMRAYFNKYKKVAEYREWLIEIWQRRGWLRARLYRRKRRLNAIDWFESKWGQEAEHASLDYSHVKNEALNFEIQATASAILNEATKKVYTGIQATRIPNLRMILTLHDALIFNCHKDYIEDAILNVKKWMEMTLPKQKGKYKYDMPLKVDALVQDYWGQGEYD